MRRLILAVVVLSPAIATFAQTTDSDRALLGKARTLYDAPFRRNLVSFDCAVQFDWTKHFLQAASSIPPTAAPLVEGLQSVSHRIVVNRAGATVSAVPKAPDLTGVEHAEELEGFLKVMAASGLNAWIPFSTDVILPVEPTHYNFEKIEPGYKLAMAAPGFDSTLLLDKEMRVTSGVSQKPQPMRFLTEFGNGPNGFVLASIKTGSTADATGNIDATFAYTYQTVQGFQLPLEVNVTSALAPKLIWRFTLSDCKAISGITITIGPPNP